MSKNKNRSKKIKPGRTLQTRDEYFEGAEKYRKPGYEHKGKYRKVVVVDTNKQDELAVVKLHKPGQSREIPGYKSTYKPFVETKDDNGKPIKVNGKFKLNNTSVNNRVSKQGVSEIKKTVFRTSKNAKVNRKKVREMKGRSTKK